MAGELTRLDSILNGAGAPRQPAEPMVQVSVDGKTILMPVSVATLQAIAAVGDELRQLRGLGERIATALEARA